MYYYDAWRVLVDLHTDNPESSVTDLFARGDYKWIHLRDFANKALNLTLLRLLAHVASGLAKADTCEECRLLETR